VLLATLSHIPDSQLRRLVLLPCVVTATVRWIAPEQQRSEPAFASLSPTSPVRVDRFVIDATEFANAHTPGATPLQQRGASTGRASLPWHEKQVQWAVTVDGDGRQIVENPCRADDDRASRSGRYAS